MRAGRGSASVALALALTLTFPQPVAADYFITPFAGIKFAGAATIVPIESGAANNKFAIGGIAGVLSDGLLGVEADVAYVPRFFERSSDSLITSSQVLTVMGNVVVAVPRSISGYSLRPFVSGGAGLMHVRINDLAALLPVRTNLFGINVGGGAVAPLSPLLDVRFDVRWFKSVTSGDEAPLREGSPLSFWRAAVGLTIR